MTGNKPNDGSHAGSYLGNSISEVTRRAILDEISVAGVSWRGELSETEFLGRVYALDSLPSTDGRFATMEGDIRQHREFNDDWPSDWVYYDQRLDLIGGPDDLFLKFLCMMVHPVTRRQSRVAKELVEGFNTHLAEDGWQLVEDRRISGRPTFVARRISGGHVVLPDPSHHTDVLSDEYVRELSEKCDARLSSGDLDGAVTVARTLLEAVLAQLEVRLTGQKGTYGGSLSKQFKQVTKLLRMDDQRPELDDRFKDVVRGLVMIANGLAPLRNQISDGHARVSKPALHHARVVVNAAKTVSSFLVESYNYQRERGLILDVSTTSAAEQNE